MLTVNASGRHGGGDGGGESATRSGPASSRAAGQQRAGGGRVSMAVHAHSDGPGTTGGADGRAPAPAARGAGGCGRAAAHHPLARRGVWDALLLLGELGECPSAHVPVCARARVLVRDFARVFLCLSVTAEARVCVRAWPRVRGCPSASAHPPRSTVPYVAAAQSLLLLSAVVAAGGAPCACQVRLGAPAESHLPPSVHVNAVGSGIECISRCDWEHPWLRVPCVHRRPLCATTATIFDSRCAGVGRRSSPGTGLFSELLLGQE